MTVELTAKHLGGDRHSEDISCEFAMCVRIVNVSGAFKNLYNGFLAADFEDLTFARLAISEFNVDDFGVFREFDVVEDDKRSFNVENSAVVDAGGDVVIALGSSGVNCFSHLWWSRIVCCFTCKLLVCLSVFESLKNLFSPGL